MMPVPVGAVPLFTTSTSQLLAFPFSVQWISVLLAVVFETDILLGSGHEVVKLKMSVKELSPQIFTVFTLQ